MTSVVVWVGVDNRGPASAYIATDSRFSWHAGRSIETWDQGRKTFASTRFADIAGYWGDVLFPVVSLSQFFESLDAGVIAGSNVASEARFRALERFLRTGFAAVPPRQRMPFTIVHAARDGELMASKFHIRTISWTGGAWRRMSLSIPAGSSAVEFGGSGGNVTRFFLAKWNSSGQGGTSRAVYSAFVDGLVAQTDGLTGGGPQLVGLYRIGCGRAFGTIVQRRRYLLGAPVASRSVGSEVEWRNELFERVSGAKLVRLRTARRHTRP